VLGLHFSFQGSALHQDQALLLHSVFHGWRLEHLFSMGVRDDTGLSYILFPDFPACQEKSFLSVSGHLEASSLDLCNTSSQTMP